MQTIKVIAKDSQGDDVRSLLLYKRLNRWRRSVTSFCHKKPSALLFSKKKTSRPILMQTIKVITKDSRGDDVRH